MLLRRQSAPSAGDFQLPGKKGSEELIEKWRDDSGGPPDGFRSMYRPAMVAFHPARRGWVREVK
jgi:hypothetical protein